MRRFAPVKFSGSRCSPASVFGNIVPSALRPVLAMRILPSDNLALTDGKAPRSAIPYFEPRYCSSPMVNSSPHMNPANVDAARPEQTGSRAADPHLGFTLPNTR